MPKEEKRVVLISCDNTECPGTDLEPNDQLGWLLISSEVYGQMPRQRIFCSPACLSVVSGDPEKWDAEPVMPEPAT